MVNFEPDDFGENSSGGSDTQTCLHCSEVVDASATICPHCKLPFDELIQVDLFPETRGQRLRKLFKPHTILLALATVLAGLGLYGYFVIQGLSSNHYIETGDYFMSSGDYASAFENYQLAVQSNPQNAEAYERLGWSEYQLALDVEALTHFENALSLESNRIMSLYGVGLSSYQLRDYQKSISYLTRVIEIDKSYVDAYEFLGLAEYRLGEYTVAYEHLNRAWIYNPQNATALYYLARIYAVNGEIESAIENFNEAEKLGFDSSSVAYARGLVWMQAGEYSSALTDLQKALTLDPTRKEIALSLAKAFYLLKDYSSAQAQLSAIQTEIPSDLQLSYLELSGWLALRQGYTNAARDIFNRWLNVDSQNPQALNAAGWAAFYSGDCINAHFYFKNASNAIQSEWVISPDSLTILEETPEHGLKIQCPID